MLTRTQIKVLTELATREERHALLARALLDERHAHLGREQELRHEISRLLPQLNSPRADIAVDARKRVEALEAELKRAVASNERRAADAQEHTTLSNSLRAAIDAVVEHAGTTRRELGLDFFRGDSRPSSFLTRAL